MTNTAERLAEPCNNHSSIARFTSGCPESIGFWERYFSYKIYILSADNITVPLMVKAREFFTA